MNRDLDGLADREHDVLVVGGGVLGAMVARDAAIRGLDVALVEQGDFASATSSNSLKIVHGGLRYLQSLDLRRARESILERSAWLRIAPHLVEPLPVIVGTRKRLTRGRPVLKAGMWLADALGWDRNRGLPDDRRLARGRLLSREECIQRVPELDDPDLTGAACFDDAYMYSSERLVLEAVEDAARRGAAVANYARFAGALRERDGSLIGGRISDVLGGGELEVRARMVVNAAGGATARVAEMLTGAPRPEVPDYSLAVNLVLDDASHDVAFGLPTAPEDGERRQLFVVPWRGRTLVGTGHYILHGRGREGARPDASEVETFVQRFREEVSAAFGDRGVGPDDVLRYHAGLLPVAPGDGPDALGRLLSRRQVLDHAEEDTPSAVTGISVKYTTSRLLAEELVDLVVRRLDVRAPDCSTAETPLPGAPSGSTRSLRDRAHESLGGRLDGRAIDHLVRTYGARLDRVVAHAKWMDDWDQAVTEGCPVIRGQLAHGAAEEMGQRPEDLLCRRTEVGALGLDDARARRVAADVLRRVNQRAPGGASFTGSAEAGAGAG